ncbi:MAG TPA: CHASE3 domain-containing protein [Polyangiaceae bacterium]|nr:CHASE3 domain-containing protein [Polyangiaceae bacterium]
MIKWSIGHKIAGGFALAVAALLLVGFLSHRSTTRLVESAEWVEHTHRVLSLLEAVLANASESETAGRGFVITGDPVYLQGHEGARERALRAINEIATLTTDNAVQQRRITSLEPLVTARFEALERVVATRRAAGFDAAQKLILEDRGRTLMSEVRRVISQMQTEENRLLLARVADERARAAATETTIVWSIGSSAVFLSWIGFLIAIGISRPLGALSRAAQSISAGDLNVELPSAARSDEVGVLVRSFQVMSEWLERMARVATRIAAGDLTEGLAPASDKDRLGTAFVSMQQSLRKSTNDLREAANVLAAAAAEILASSTQMASGASEAAAAVTETTTTVEEVKQTAQLSSDKARLVSDNAQKANQIGQDGRRAVEGSIEGLERISQQMGAIAEMVVKLSEQSQAISDIVATVTDLADQSNLLAVNASIEAARAGEQGRAFGVVAQEVRSLAERSKQATAQVRGILTDTQRAISGAVLATEQGSKIVRGGVAQAHEANGAIRTLVETIELGAQAAMQIAASSQQQSIGMDQIAIAMDNIRQASLQHVSGTKQSEVAARNLHEVGQKLKELVGRYRL